MGKRRAIFLAGGIALVIAIVVLIIAQASTPWLPYVSRFAAPPPVVARIQATNGQVRVFSGLMGALLILPDGSLWRWGLAGGDQFPRAVMPQQIGTNRDWIQASPALGECVALRKDGTWWYWGTDFAGPLISPVRITNLIVSPKQLADGTDWVSVATGDSHSSGLRKDGTIWAWGHDELGQMGNGLGAKETNAIRFGSSALHPIQTNLVQVGSNRDWIAIGGRGSETIALRADGTMWVWGRIDWFANGQPSAIFPVPTQICCETNWVSIEQDCAIDRQGQVWYLFRAPPDATAPAATTCLLMATNCVAGRFAMAMPGVYQVHSNGTLWLTELTWHGAPDAHVAVSRKPRRVGKRSDWISLSGAGMGTAVGLTADGTVWMWGTDIGQEGKTPLGLKMNLLGERIMGWVGLTPSNPHSPGGITPIQKTPRPLIKIMPEEAQ